MKKLITILMTSMLLIQIAPAVSAKQKGDWNNVKAFLHYSIAVKTKLGETYFGLMQSADDSSITVQIADEKGFTPQEINFQRNEVAKVWSATLRFGEHHVVELRTSERRSRHFLRQSEQLLLYSAAGRVDGRADR